MIYKTFIYTLIGLCLASGAYGASMTIVDLPVTGTDAAIDIDQGNTEILAAYGATESAGNLLKNLILRFLAIFAATSAEPAVNIASE